MIGKVNSFFDFVLTSALIDQPAVQPSRLTRSLTADARDRRRFTTASPRKSVTDAAIRRFCARDQKRSVPENHREHPLFPLRATRRPRRHGAGRRHARRSAATTARVGTRTFYAVMPYASCAGCTAGLPKPFDAVTSISSHENSAKRITDPIPGQGWYDDTNGEIGDICAWQTRRSALNTVSWSGRIRRNRWRVTLWPHAGEIARRRNAKGFPSSLKLRDAEASGRLGRRANDAA